MAAPVLSQSAENIPGFPKNVRALSAISDTVDNALWNSRFYSNMIWTATAGNIALVLEDNSTLVVPAPIAGRWHKMPPFKRIKSTDTYANPVILIGRAFR